MTHDPPFKSNQVPRPHGHIEYLSNNHVFLFVSAASKAFFIMLFTNFLFYHSHFSSVKSYEAHLMVLMTSFSLDVHHISPKTRPVLLLAVAVFILF